MGYFERRRKAPRVLLLSGISAWAFAAAGLAEEAASNTNQQVALSGESAGIFANPAGGAELVLVTARRREESAQTVPISLDVLGQAQIENAGQYTLQQLQNSVPTLVATNYNARNANINIRGLGSNVTTANDGLENGVGFYIDQVYYGRVGLTQFDLIDIDQIEVLHGPQGTLFGKNTTAGAINITTRKPSFEPEAKFLLSGGDFGYYQAQASVSGPLLGDKIAGRISLADTRRSGFVRDVTTNTRAYDYNNFNARGQILANVNEDLSLRLITDFSRQKRHCCVNLNDGVITTYTDGTPIADNFYQKAARAGYKLPASSVFDFVTDADSPFQANMEQWGVSLEGDWKVGGGALTSITAYRQWNWYPRNDNDIIALPILVQGHIVDHQQQWSQEVRYASPTSDTFDYQVGLYYFWQIIDGYTTVQYGSAAPSWFLGTSNALYQAALNGYTTGAPSNPETTSYAAFGQANWHITPELTLTGGVRYTYEDKQGAYNNSVIGGANISALPAAQQAAIIAIRNNFSRPQAYKAKLHSGSASGLVTLSYQWSPSLLAYATYSHGEKSGGINLTQLPISLLDPLVRPEVVDTYEIGAKSQWFDSTLTANVALFWTDVGDYQTQVFDPNPPYGSSISNIPSVRSRGFEASLAWAPLENVNFGGGASYTDAVYVRYPTGPAPVELGPTTIYHYADLSGKPLASAPKWAFTGSADVTQPLGIAAPWDLGQISGYIHADTRYQSSNYTAVSDSIYSLVKAYDLTNLRVGLRSEKTAWDLSFYANNLFNTHYYLTRSVATTGQISGVPGDPRTVGLTLKVNY